MTLLTLQARSIRALFEIVSDPPMPKPAGILYAVESKVNEFAATWREWFANNEERLRQLQPNYVPEKLNCKGKASKSSK
jgi:hypothetical protein